MAFLDNSGDIILDAVLTDTGRLRLAQGDGSFKISKFALGDDEINYAIYNKSHSSGSAYYDLEVLQTPVLEAFTNNTSNLKTKLVSISRTNILYMPILKLNTNTTNDQTIPAGFSDFYFRNDLSGAGDAVKRDFKFYVAVDKDTYNYISKVGSAGNTGISVGNLTGLIQGYTADTDDKRNLIRVDQGLDTNEISPTVGLDTDLLESAFIVELDYRLARVKGPKNHTPAAVNFIDDDNIAQYYLTEKIYVDPESNSSPAAAEHDNSKQKTDLETFNPQVFEGPRGKSFQFRLHASQDLHTSTYLFEQLGASVAATSANFLGIPTSGTGTAAGDGKTIFYIDSVVRVVGANTGYRLDIPIRYIKIA